MKTVSESEARIRRMRLAYVVPALLGVAGVAGMVYLFVRYPDGTEVDNVGVLLIFSSCAAIVASVPLGLILRDRIALVRWRSER